MATPQTSHSSQMDILDEIFGSEWSAAPQHHHLAQQQQQQQQQQHAAQQQQQQQQQIGGSLLMRVPTRLKIEPSSTPMTSSVTTCLTPGPTLSSMSSEDSVGDDVSEHESHSHSQKPDFAADTTTPPPRRNSNNSIRGNVGWSWLECGEERLVSARLSLNGHYALPCFFFSIFNFIRF